MMVGKKAFTRHVKYEANIYMLYYTHSFIHSDDGNIESNTKKNALQWEM